MAARDATGEIITPLSDTHGRLSRLDDFTLMFPPQKLVLMHRLMNNEMTKFNSLDSKSVSKGELLKFFGILVINKKFVFGSRASLWSTTALHKYVPAPSFGRTGMSRQRLDFLFCYLLFGEQPAIRLPDMSSEKFWWKLVDDFINNYNTYMHQTLFTQKNLCR